jgi:hypothetical protein
MHSYQQQQRFKVILSITQSTKQKGIVLMERKMSTHMNALPNVKTIQSNLFILADQPAT